MTTNATTQTEPQTEIDSAVYLAVLDEVLKIEEENGIIRDTAEYPQEWLEWINYYAVVHGGDGSNRHLPVTAYANFKTEVEATSFQLNALAEFPSCRVAKQARRAEDEAGHREALRNLFTFCFRLTTDEFKPRAKRGEVLTMQRYIKAEDGDIVATGSGDNQLNRVDLYVDGMEYWAVCVARSFTYR